MGSAASKPAKSAAQAASRRQYPKQPTAPPTSGPATAARRSPPQRPPPPQAQAPSQPQPGPKQSAPPVSGGGPQYHSHEPPSSTKSNAIDLDGRDPDFAAHLRHIGPVTPNPTFSHTSTFSPQQSAQQPIPSGPGQSAGSSHSIFPPSAAANPALLVVTARQRFTKAAEQEAEAVGRPSFTGREFLDAVTLRQVLSMRDRQGLGDREIERALRLKGGVVGRLGERGIVGEVS